MEGKEDGGGVRGGEEVSRLSSKETKEANKKAERERERKIKAKAHQINSDYSQRLLYSLGT
jgi:hypothetical protein